MKILFRVDAATFIGTGHVMRCLTLAGEFRKRGAEVEFLCREYPGHLCDYIERMGYHVYMLPYPYSSVAPAFASSLESLRMPLQLDMEQTKRLFAEQRLSVDMLVVDHYLLDIRWESEIRKYARKIMVIDDLADRPHDCDYLLDQNFYYDMQTRYEKLVPKQCKTFLGPEYALLRPEFRQARKAQTKRSVNRVFVFYSGTDPTNETEKTLEAIERLNQAHIQFDVVVGAGNPRKKRIKQWCERLPNTTYYCQVENMAELMSKADLALGAGGATTWERCYIGLPSIIIMIANNQRQSSITLEKKGVLKNLGWYEDVTAIDIEQAIQEMIFNPDQLCEMSEKGLSLFERSWEDRFNFIQEILEECRNQ